VSLQPLGKSLTHGKLVLAGLHAQLELLEPGEEELPVLVVPAGVHALHGSQLEPHPGEELLGLPPVLVGLDGRHQPVPPRLGLLLQPLQLPGKALRPGLDLAALWVLAAHKLVCCPGHFHDDPTVCVNLQLKPLVLGQKLHRAVFILAKVAALQSLVLVIYPVLHLSNLKEELLGPEECS